MPRHVMTGFGSGYLVKLYLPSEQKHQIWRSASHGHNKKNQSVEQT